MRAADRLAEPPAFSAGLAPKQHIEAHGRLGLHKCIAEGCQFSHGQSIAEGELDIEICKVTAAPASVEELTPPPAVSTHAPPATTT